MLYVTDVFWFLMFLSMLLGRNRSIPPVSPTWNRVASFMYKKIIGVIIHQHQEKCLWISYHQKFTHLLLLHACASTAVTKPIGLLSFRLRSLTHLGPGCLWSERGGLTVEKIKEGGSDVWSLQQPAWWEPSSSHRCRCHNLHQWRETFHTGNQPSHAAAMFPLHKPARKNVGFSCIIPCFPSIQHRL